MGKTTVLIIDDSALVRQLLSEILNSDPNIEVIGTAADPIIAREKIKRLNPDVLTLDIEMPRMDGITFLKNLMRLHPMPVVMVSTLTKQGAQITLDALALGAVDFVAKPKVNSTDALLDYAEALITKVKIASIVNIHNLVANALIETQKPLASSVSRIANSNSREKIIAIGSSTGGTEAIKKILSSLPADCPAIVIAQHIPVHFSKMFAERVNLASVIDVCEAQDGQQILAGHAYIAPGDKHLMIERRGQHYFCKLDDGPKVNHHKPSVDVLFDSLAQNAGADVIGVMLTGMGGDGAQGMLKMKEAGAINFVQDEKSSVVWGMPKQAVKVGAAEQQVPLASIASKLMSLV